MHDAEDLATWLRTGNAGKGGYLFGARLSNRSAIEAEHGSARARIASAEFAVRVLHTVPHTASEIVGGCVMLGCPSRPPDLESIADKVAAPLTLIQRGTEGNAQAIVLLYAILMTIEVAPGGFTSPAACEVVQSGGGPAEAIRGPWDRLLVTLGSISGVVVEPTPETAAPAGRLEGD